MIGFPSLFRDHMLYQVNFLAPGRPMMEMIENQVYLAQGEYIKVIGKSDSTFGNVPEFSLWTCSVIYLRFRQQQPMSSLESVTKPEGVSVTGL